jgi:hypothetical protein
MRAGARRVAISDEIRVASLFGVEVRRRRNWSRKSFGEVFSLIGDLEVRHRAAFSPEAL